MPRPTPSWALGESLPSGRGQVVDRKFFDDLRQWIEDNEYAKSQMLGVGTDLYVRVLAHLTAGYTRERAFGPRQNVRNPNPALSWKIPVARWSGRYAGGWSVNRINQAHYVLRNREREAYFIEIGAHTSGKGRPRPVTKLAILSMIRFISAMRMDDLFVESTFGARRDQRGRFQAFAGRMRGTDLVATAGPQGRLPT